MNGFVSDRIRLRMNKRLEKFYKPIALLLGEDVDYYVAGNSCNSLVPNDYDIYPIEDKFDFDEIKTYAEKMKMPIVSETKNALTIIINGKPVQFCSYIKSSLLDLIESFDFAHIQIGMLVHNEWDGEYKYSKIKEIRTTCDWEESQLLNTTWYTCSEYPLSSLLRCVKYAQRGDFAGKSWKVSMMDIVKDIVERGYKDYDDFKDQISAIDLVLLDENESNSAFELFKTFQNKGLVNS